MTLITAIILGLAMGIVFCFLLEKARVFEPGMIVGQMQLSNFTMLKVFLTAVATGMLVLALLNGLDMTKLHLKGAFVWADLVGGFVLGVGIALAGACPGTVLAQVGVGYRDAVWTLIGGLFGALAFGYSEPVLKPLLKAQDLGKITLADVSGLPYWVLALSFAVVLIFVLYTLEKWRPWRSDMGRDYDGD